VRKDGFFDEQRHKHLFKFDVTNWINDNKEDSKDNIKCEDTQLARSRFGGIGAISVYFYKVKDLEKVERLNNHSKDRVKKVEVLESTGIEMEMKFSTGFENI